MLNAVWGVLDKVRDAARKRRWHPNHAFGRRGEDLAHRRLRSLGYTVVARNYRTSTGSGEVDLIAWEGGTLVFVEVKSRRGDEFGTPDRAVDRDKRRRLIKAARTYVGKAAVDWQMVRFDVVSIVDGPRPEITLIRDAFPTRLAMT